MHHRGSQARSGWRADAAARASSHDPARVMHVLVRHELTQVFGAGPRALAELGDEPALSISELDLPGGSLTVVTGASGAGTSTLLQVLAGALRPMAGSVRIGGTDPRALGYEALVAGVTLMEQDSQLLSGTVAACFSPVFPVFGVGAERPA